MLRRTSLILAIALAPVFTYAQANAVDLNADRITFDQYRGLWVDRFDYSVSTAATKIPQIMENARLLGITDVMFQVRGEANAFYNQTNGYESKASGVTASNDPLKIAIDSAHARGIRLHAYVNAMPLWRGTAAAPANHVYNTHPEFRIRDENGVEMPLNSSYVISNPARDEFRTHFNNVVGAIATNYNIDGIHLDYIRLVNDTSPSTAEFNYPMDPYTRDKFTARYPGLPINKANMQMFLADEISTLVRSLRDTTKAAKPNAQLTASVWRDADIGLNSYQQDWARWIDQGMIDAVMPMIYRKTFGAADSLDLYRLNTEEAMSRRGNAGVMIGLGTYMQDDATSAYATVINQLTYARDQGANGVQIFDYGTLYNGTAAQNETKRALQDFFAANSGKPALTTLADFNADEGTFKWGPTSGSNQSVAPATTADRVTDEARSGAGAQRLVIHKSAGAGSFLLRHLSGTSTGGDAASNLPLASIGSVGLWIKTTTPDLQVSFGADDDTSITSSTRSTAERSYFQNIIADGEWHQYQWSLSDPTHWDTWGTPALGNGHLSSIFSTDAIHITGTAAVSTLFIDDVFYDAGYVAPGQWTLDASGSYHTPGNWTGGIPNTAGAVASFRRRATGPRTITLDKATTVGTLQFDSAASYTLAGTAFPLNLNNPGGNAAVQVINRGAHTISAQLNLQDDVDVLVDRGSTLTITKPLAGGLTRAISKQGDGALKLAPDQDIASLSISAGAVILQNGNKHTRLASLNIADGATLDLGDNDLAILATGSNRAALLAHVTTRVAAARNGNASKWTAPGLTSSAAAANPLTTLAVLLNDRGNGTPFMATFDGRAVDINSILVKHTYVGDLNLDGRISIADYLRLDRGHSMGLTGYANGDIDYSGVIDGGDYFLIDQAFLGQGAPMNGSAFDAAAVPEPAFLAALPLAAAVLLRRRRIR